VPEAAVVAAGTEALAVVAPVIATGPLHEKSVTFKGVFAVRASVAPSHIGLLLLALVREGAAFTETVVVAWLIQPALPEPSLTVSV